MIKDYDNMMGKVQYGKMNRSLLPVLFLLLEDARLILFPGDKFKKLKYWQLKRIWKLAKLTIRFVTTLIAIFR